jgi:hypothetical protein
MDSLLTISLAFARKPHGLPWGGSARRPHRSVGEGGCTASAEFRLASPQMLRALSERRGLACLWQGSRFNGGAGSFTFERRTIP